MKNKINSARYLSFLIFFEKKPEKLRNKSIKTIRPNLKEIELNWNIHKNMKEHSKAVVCLLKMYFSSYFSTYSKG